MAEEFDVSLGTPKKAAKTHKEVLARPRSRLADSREASFRNKQEKIDFYTQSFNRVNKGTLHIPKEWWPEGYSIMWVRESVKGVQDARNLAHMESNGWEPIYADEMPQLAFFSPEGLAQDDAQLVRVNGMRLMKRLEEIHVAHDRALAKDREHQAKIKNNIRSIDKDLHPFAVNTGSSNAQFFPSDPMASSFASSFNTTNN